MKSRARYVVSQMMLHTLGRLRAYRELFREIKLKDFHDHPTVGEFIDRVDDDLPELEDEQNWQELHELDVMLGRICTMFDVFNI